MYQKEVDFTARKAWHIILAVLLAVSLSIVPFTAWGDEGGVVDEPAQAAEEEILSEEADEAEAEAEEAKAEEVSSEAVELEEDQPANSAAVLLGNPAPSETEEESAEENAATIAVTVKVVGQDDEGNPVTWMPLTEAQATKGQDAMEISKTSMLKSGLTPEISVSGWGPSLDAISKGETKLAGGPVEGGWVYWAFLVNGEMSSVGAGSYVPEEGDSLAWIYTSSYTPELPAVTEVPVDPEAEHPDVDAEWPRFVESDQGAEVEAPTATDDAELAWTYEYSSDKPSDDGYPFAFASDPLIIDNKLYVVTSTGVSDKETYAPSYDDYRLVVLNPATGEIIQQLPPASEDASSLTAPIDVFARPVYSDGIIVLPLVGGQLQAISAKTLETLWVSEPLTTSKGDPHKALSTLYAQDGKVYLATTSGYGEAEGALIAYNLKTGARFWEKPSEKGYYWAGPTVLDYHLIVGGDDGVLLSIDAATGDTIDSLTFDNKIRSSVIKTGENNVVFMSADGTMHQVEVGDDGAITEVGKVNIIPSGSGSSTSTPAIVGNLAFVGGADFEAEGGVLAVVDLNTMTVMHSIKVPAAVQSSPVVSNQESGTYAYFTVNIGDENGGLYVYKLGDEEAQQLYLPEGEKMNWSTSSPVVASDGTIIFTNDSGTIFALKGAKVIPDKEETQPEKEPQKDGNSTKPQKSENKSVDTSAQKLPKTSDDFPIAMVVLALLGTIIVVVAIILLGQKRKKR